MLQCSTCGSPQPMQINGVYAALYRGMDVILLQCVNCGTERTERLAGGGSVAAAADGAGRQSR